MKYFAIDMKILLLPSYEIFAMAVKKFFPLPLSSEFLRVCVCVCVCVCVLFVSVGQSVINRNQTRETT